MKGSEILKVARELLGRPYRWGAAGPDRFDCSGLVDYVARRLGVTLGERKSAAMLRASQPTVASPRPGNLAYWRNGRGRVFHVALVVDIDGSTVRTIGAHSGDSSTTTDERAREQGARVKARDHSLGSVDSFTVFPGQSVPWQPEPQDLEAEPEEGDDLPPWWI